MLRRNTLIVLALFLITLTAFLIYQNQKTASLPIETESVIPTPLPALFDFSADPVKSLTLTYATGQKAVFKKGTDGLWMVTEPQNSILGPEAVESIVAQIGQLAPVSTLVSAPSPDLVGLTRPSKSFSLLLTSGKSLVLKIGDVAPTGNAYYAQINDEATIIINKYMLDGIETQITQALLTPTPEPGPESVSTPPAITPVP